MLGYTIDSMLRIDATQASLLQDGTPRYAA
jgi:hypothetical protein